MTEIIAAIITALSGMLSSWLSFRRNRSTSIPSNELKQMKALFPKGYSRLIELQLATRIWEYEDQGRGEIVERICLAGITPAIGLVLFLFVLDALGEANDGNSYAMYSGLVDAYSCIPLVLLFVLGVALLHLRTLRKRGIEKIAKLNSDEGKEQAVVERTAKTNSCRRCCRATALIVAVLSIVLIILIAFYLQNCLKMILLVLVVINLLLTVCLVEVASR